MPSFAGLGLKSEEKVMITHTICSRLLLLFLFLIVSASSLLAQQQSTEQVVVSSHALDGKTYFGQNGSKGKEADHDDEFIFKNGMYRSTSCDKYDFAEGPYETKVVDGVTFFKAVTASPTHGQMTWEGKVDGDSIEGTFVWTKERWYWDIRKEYWLNGKLKQ
jgi:hypothetical protein